MTSHRERAAEYADAALTMRTMMEALELRAAEELALAREDEIEAEQLAAVIPLPVAAIAMSAPLLPSAFSMNMTDAQFAAWAASLARDVSAMVRIAA